MPGGTAHRIDDQFRKDAAAILSDDQFDKLVAILDDQHKAMEAMLKPIHDIAILLLADRNPESGETKKEPDPEETKQEG